MKKQLEVIEGTKKRKEKQIWKLDENIKELKSASEDAQDSLNKLNRRVVKLCAVFEGLLSKNIGRKVKLTRASF